MKRKVRTLISCLLIPSLCIGLLSATALAADPPAGTVEDPTVTETVTTDTKQDTPAPGQTTTTTTTEKEWEGRDGTEENGTTVKGSETTTETTVASPDGSRDTIGTQTGSELTTETKTTTETKEDQPSGKETAKTITRTGIEEGEENPAGTETVKSEETARTETPTGATADYTGAEAALKPGEEKNQEFSGTADPKDALAALGGSRDMTFDENGKHTETTTGKTTDGKDVEITTVYEEVKDDADNVISYTKTVTTRELTPESTTTKETGRTDVEGAEKPTGERETDGNATTTISAVVTPPQKPDPAAPVTDESGVTTETTVEEIREVVENSGSTEPQVVGYRVTTTRKGADGQLLSSKSDSVYGTITITKTVTQPMQQDTTDSVQTVSETVTRVYRQTVHTETATVTVTNGKLHAEMGNVRKGERHGKTNMSSLQPTVLKPGDRQFDGNDLYGRTNKTGGGSSSDLPYQWKGEYGLESRYRVNDTNHIEENPSTWQAHQFILEDGNGNKYYTYCADFQTDAESGWKYAMENVEDADYYNNEAAKHIRAIAYEGYWGTGKGIGSLQNLKEILLEKLGKNDNVYGLTADEIHALTDGQALTATQAAIWKFGNCGKDTKVNDGAICGKNYLGGDAFDLASDPAKSTIQKLYNYLIAQTKDPTPRTTLLDEKTIQGAKAKVASKNTDGTYNVSLDFVLAVTPDARNEDLVINVYQGDEKIGTKKLSDLTGTSTNGTYTIDGLKLSNGANVELRLEGTHQLETGVYLYSSEVRSENGEKKTAQTFVGIASGTQKVDLRVLVNLAITDPVAKIIRSGSEQEQLVTTTQDRTCTETKTLTHYSNDVQITTTQVDRSGRSWENHWQSHWEPTTPPDQPPEEPEEPETPEAPETPVAPAVPGYDVPKTGDASGLYSILSIFSALGLALVTCAGRKRRTA